MSTDTPPAQYGRGFTKKVDYANLYNFSGVSIQLFGGLIAQIIDYNSFFRGLKVTFEAIFRLSFMIL
jgi:hypothetical protein